MKKHKYPKLKYRWFNWLYAFIHGYYWKACPICGKKFGGHEDINDCGLMLSQSSGTSACQECYEKVQELNDKFMKSDVCKKQLEKTYGKGAHFLGHKYK